MSGNFDFINKKKSYSIESINKEKNKRSGPDTLVRLGFIMSIFSWIIFVAMFIFFSKSQPQDDNFFNRFHKVSMRHSWDTRLLHYTYYSAILLFISSMINLAIFKFRSKRKSDKVNWFIIFSILISIIAMIFYFFKVIKAR